MIPKLVIGAPVWQRSWCLDIWFDSVFANCEPASTGLVFVVPPNDTQSRDVISRRARGFAFAEVLRDRHDPADREVRLKDNHASLAAARNLLLHHVCKVHPEWFLSWDSDFLVGPGVVQKLQTYYDRPATTVWAWLNRKPPQQGQHWDEETQSFVPVEWNEPFNGTAMDWDKKPGYAVHKDPARWIEYQRGIWRADVILAFQLMKAPVYERASYAPHPHGEDIPFNLALERQGIERWCYGEQPGLHLFDRSTAEEEVREGYPSLMRLATTDIPLAATRAAPIEESLRVIGFYRRGIDSIVPEPVSLHS